MGESSQSSSSWARQESAQPSELTAKHMLRILARINDLNITGSQLQAGDEITLDSAGAFNLLAAVSRGQQHSQQESSSSSFGFTAGTSSGLAATMGLSEGWGNGKGHSTTHQPSHVKGQKVTIHSRSKDAHIQGRVEAERISGTFGRNLHIESVQDSEQQRRKSEGFGFSLSAGINQVSGSVNASTGRMRSNYDSVQEQAGFFAGKQGYSINVAEHTQLDGAAINCEQDGVKQSNLTSGTLNYHDIHNRAEYDAHQVNLGFGYSKKLGGQQSAPVAGAQAAQSVEGGVGKNQQGEAVAGAGKVPGSVMPSYKGFSPTVPVAMRASGNVSSVTESNISGAKQTVHLTNPERQQQRYGRSAEATIADINDSIGAEEQSNRLNPIFDKAKIEANFATVAALGREVITFLENRTREIDIKREEAARLEGQGLHDQANALRSRATEIEKQWGMGGKGRIALNAFGLAAGSNVSAGIDQLLQATTINVIQSYGAQQIKLIADKLGSEPARMAMHSILAGAGAAAQGGNVASAAMGASASVALNNLMEAAYGQAANDLTAAEREACKNLVTSIISGSAEIMGLDPAMANAAATIEAENNMLGLGGGLTSHVIRNASNLTEEEKEELIRIDREARLQAGGIAGGIVGGIYFMVAEDAAALIRGQTTIEQVIKERGIDYVTGKLGGYLVKGGFRLKKSLTGQWHLEAISKGTSGHGTASRVGKVTGKTAGKGAAAGKVAGNQVKPETVNQSVSVSSATVKSSAGQIDALNLREMIDSAKMPVNGSGLSASARAWEKHAGRQNTAFGSLKGNVEQKNTISENFVREILTNKDTVCTQLSRGGKELRLPDGRGIRYNADGTFCGFVDPWRPK